MTVSPHKLQTNLRFDRIPLGDGGGLVQPFVRMVGVIGRLIVGVFSLAGRSLGLTGRMAKGVLEVLGRHPLATGGCTLAGLVLSLYALYLDRSNSAQSNEQMAAVQQAVAAIARDVESPKTWRPSFAGRWSDENALELAWPGAKYDRARFPPAEGGDVEEGEVPTLVRSFFIPLKQSDVRVILTGLSEGTCNACGVQLSLFAFTQSESRWYLSDEARNFTRDGRQGELNWGKGLEGLEVWELGDGRFGFVMPTSAWHQGIEFDGLKIYAFVAGELLQVFAGETHRFFAGLEKEEAIKEGYWEESRFTFKFSDVDSNFGFRDIIGVYQTHEMTKGATIRIRFDGARYPYQDLDALGECVKKALPNADLSCSLP